MQSANLYVEHDCNGVLMFVCVIKERKRTLENENCIVRVGTLVLFLTLEEMLY